MALTNELLTEQQAAALVEVVEALVVAATAPEDLDGLVAALDDLKSAVQTRQEAMRLRAKGENATAMALEAQAEAALGRVGKAESPTVML